MDNKLRTQTSAAPKTIFPPKTKSRALRLKKTHLIRISFQNAMIQDVDSSDSPASLQLQDDAEDLLKMSVILPEAKGQNELQDEYFASHQIPEHGDQAQILSAVVKDIENSKEKYERI